MADANSIQSDVSGVTPGTDQPEVWRKVFARHPRNIGDIVSDASRGPWKSHHAGNTYSGTFDAFEQVAVTAEQIAFRHTFSDGIERDPGDIFIELMEFAIQWRKANGLPTSAK